MQSAIEKSVVMDSLLWKPYRWDGFESQTTSLRDICMNFTGTQQFMTRNGQELLFSDNMGDVWIKILPSVVIPGSSSVVISGDGDAIATYYIGEPYKFNLGYGRGDAMQFFEIEYPKEIGALSQSQPMCMSRDGKTLFCVSRNSVLVYKDLDIGSKSVNFANIPFVILGSGFTVMACTAEGTEAFIINVDGTLHKYSRSEESITQLELPNCVGVACSADGAQVICAVQTEIEVSIQVSANGGRDFIRINNTPLTPQVQWYLSTNSAGDFVVFVTPHYILTMCDQSLLQLYPNTDGLTKIQFSQDLSVFVAISERQFYTACSNEVCINTGKECDYDNSRQRRVLMQDCGNRQPWPECNRKQLGDNTRKQILKDKSFSYSNARAEIEPYYRVGDKCSGTGLVNSPGCQIGEFKSYDCGIVTHLNVVCESTNKVLPSRGDPDLQLAASLHMTLDGDTPGVDNYCYDNRDCQTVVDANEMIKICLEKEPTEKASCHVDFETDNLESKETWTSSCDDIIYKFCTANDNKNMANRQCVAWASKMNMTGAPGLKWDQLMGEYCEVYEKPKQEEDQDSICACILSKIEGSTAACIDPRCTNNPNAYKTKEMKEADCPDICQNIINANAGGNVIIDNAEFQITCNNGGEYPPDAITTWYDCFDPNDDTSNFTEADDTSTERCRRSKEGEKGTYPNDNYCGGRCAQERHDCNELGQCVITAGGRYTTNNCDTKCTRWDCNDAGNCQLTIGGKYLEPTCGGNCIQIDGDENFECTGNVCRRSTNGRDNVNNPDCCSNPTIPSSDFNWTAVWWSLGGVAVLCVIIAVVIVVVRNKKKHLKTE